MIKKHTQFIDTSLDGLILSIEHNLNGFPVPFITEETENGDRKTVSLYDSRIGEIRTKGPHLCQLTFTSNFKGFIDLILFDGSYVTLKERLDDVEQKMFNIYCEQKQLTPKSSWRKVNDTYDNRIKDLEYNIRDLSAQIANLRNTLLEL